MMRTMSPPKALEDLREISTEIQHLDSILSLLHWDQETYMPLGGISPRSHQISTLSALIHEKKTSKKFKKALEALISLKTGKLKIKGLSPKEKAMIREWLKNYTRLRKLPSSFIKTFTAVTSEATQVWSLAKKNNQFQLFQPFLTKIIELNQKKAEILGYQDHPYDALLEHYEPCMNTRKLDAIFGRLKKQISALLDKILSKKELDSRFLFKKVPHEKQLQLGLLLLQKLPMEHTYTRLDLSSHPFSIAMHPHDSRITTRILPHHFMSNLFSILHEAGHSYYEMGLLSDNFGTPLGEPVSLSIHESQSRWWETLIGRSLPFWQWFYPILKKECPSLLKSIPLERFYRSFNKVTPSLIRVEADEVSYCLHVILRYEIEKELMTHKLSVQDLPKRWNEKFLECFGLTPPNDSLGCLQDIHWSLGDFGYFPTYALGNLFAAQFFTSFVKDHPDWGERVARGDLAFIRDWLASKIHRWGRMYNSEELVKKITGKPLSETAYCNYLKGKYKEIYNF